MTILETASVQVAEHDLSVLTPTDLEPRIGAVQQLDARPLSPPLAEDRNLRREVLKRNVEPTAVCKKRLRGVSDLKNVLKPSGLMDITTALSYARRKCLFAKYDSLTSFAASFPEKMRADEEGICKTC